MKVEATDTDIIVTDTNNVEIMRVALNDPILNHNLNAVIDSNEHLQVMYNSLVRAAQLIKIIDFVHTTMIDTDALRIRLDELAYNEFVAKEGSTAAVLKARLH